MAELAQCTAEQVVDAVEAVALAGRACSAAQIAEFVGHPVATVERATAVAVQLGLLVPDGSSFQGSATYNAYFIEASEARRIDVLRFALEAFQPYRFFKQRLGFHRDPGRAAREAKLKFGYTNHEGEISATLLSLGQFSGSLSYTKESGYVVASSEAVDEFLTVAEALSLAGSSVEDFIKSRLGEEAYAFVQDENDDIITHLRGAFGRIADDDLGEGTVLLLANACENFLVKLADEAAPAVDLTGAHGVNAKASRLHAAGVIAQKHLGFTSFVGQLRNAADHGIDDEVNMDWQITPEAVRLGGLVLLAGIRSILALSNGRAAF